MEGKLVAANTSDSSRLWQVTLEDTSSAGGGFGCAPAATTVAIYGSPAVSADLVYVGGYNGKIYAFSFGRDEPRWVYPRQVNLEGAVVGGLVVAEGRVYFGAADGKVYALEAADGYKEWEFETGGKVWSSPAVAGDTIYIGSFDNKLYALNLADGNKKWDFETEGAIVATPLVADGTVYIGSFDRYLYALDAADGSLKWKFMAENWFWAKPLIHNGVVYAACLDGKVYALQAESGNKLVEFDLGVPKSIPISSSPVLVDNVVVVATEGGVVYTLGTDDNQQGQLLDLEEKVYAPLATKGGKVYIHTDKDALYEVDALTGAIREFNIKS